MKRLWIITAVLLAVALAGITVWHLLPPGAPAPSELFRRYEHQNGVRVGYIEDFRFDDSTLVDVVTLEAIEPDGWRWMEDEFNLSAHQISHDSTEDPGSTRIDFWPCDDGQGIAVLSRSDSALCFVQPRSQQELEHVIMYYLKKMKE